MDFSNQTLTKRYSVKDTFGLEVDRVVMGFSERTDHVPKVDEAYQFNLEVTQAILAGFTHNRRALIQGMHGTGKSTHIEQVAARLNWPCMRINLDGHLTRLELVGKDAIVLKDGKQVTEFQDGILPWSIQRPIALILDEYDAGRPDIMFVIQRLLEKDGKLTLMEQNRVITPHPQFRLFATSNTVGLGNVNGLYHGTQILNHAQLDRWNLIATLNYLPVDKEVQIVLAHVPEKNSSQGMALINRMVTLAALTRQGFETGDLSCLMSPRTVITWAENCEIFKDCELAFKLTFFNKCEESEQAILEEYYQRCFDRELLG